MKISVITVCYNAAKTIRDTLESVRAQKGETQRIRGSEGGDGERIEIEHIVVDGGSTDGTVEIIKEFALRCPPPPLTSTSYCFRWLSEKDNGMYDALNKGIRMATGDVIGILNSDDRFADERVLADVAGAFETQRIRGSEGWWGWGAGL